MEFNYRKQIVTIISRIIDSNNTTLITKPHILDANPVNKRYQKFHEIPVLCLDIINYFYYVLRHYIIVSHHLWNLIIR